MKKKLNALAAMLLAMCMLLCACGNQPGEQPSGQSGTVKNTLDNRTISDITTFDPFATADISTQQVHYQIFDSLLYDDENGELHSNICTDYTFSPDGDVIYFTIRDGVKFHNGDTVTAEDVVFSINTAIASAFTSKVTSNLSSAELTPDGKVAVTLKAPVRGSIYAFASSNLAIVPKAVYEADKDAFGKNPVGSGPFYLDSVKTGESITLKAFEDYWRGAAEIKTITTHVISDNATAIMALQSGSLDICQPSQDFSDRQAIIDNPNLAYYEAPQPCFFLCFNTESELMSNKTLRQAIAHAINTEELIMGAVNGVAYDNPAPMTKSAPEYPEGIEGITYDVELAKKLLAEAGYPNGLDLTIRVIAATNYSKPAEIIQEQLKQININVRVEQMERAAWNEQVYAGGDYDLSFWAHAITVLDGDFAMYPFFHSSQANGQGANMYNYKNPTVDRLLEEGRYEQDETVRKEIYREMCEIILDDAVLVPCYGVYRTMAANVNLKNVHADGMSRYYSYNYSWAD